MLTTPSFAQMLVTDTRVWSKKGVNDLCTEVPQHPRTQQATAIRDPLIVMGCFDFWALCWHLESVTVFLAELFLEHAR